MILPRARKRRSRDRPARDTAGTIAETVWGCGYRAGERVSWFDPKARVADPPPP